MGGTLAGMLTALPGLCFAVFGLLANRVSAWAGQVGALAIAAALTTIGLTLRVLTGSWVLFLLLSVVALAGMAAGNVVLPALIKKVFPRHSDAMATTYTTFLAVGATAPTLLSAALQRWGNAILSPGEGWRISLGVWSAIACLALILWVLAYAISPGLRRGGRVRRDLTRTEPTQPTTAHRTDRKRSIWRSRTAVSLMFFFGLQSMQAYIQFGWVPAAFRAGGLTEGQAGMMLAIIAMGGIPGGLIMPTVAARSKPRTMKAWIILFSVLLALGYLGVAFLPTTLPWLWAVCLSISGFCFPTALALIISKTSNPLVTGRVSGFVQPVGYVLAALGPFLVGSAWQVVGDWPPIFLVLSLGAIPLAASGIIAVSGRKVDVELGLVAP